VSQPVVDFSCWLAGQPFNDAAYWLTSAYANWVGEKVRAAQALYFTPPKLADRVIDDLVARGACLANSHWHDPACGGAAFLVPTAQRMAAALVSSGVPVNEVISRVQKQISGSDLDKTLLSISEQFLLMALYPYLDGTSNLPSFNLRNADGLLTANAQTQSPDVVVCNPPYRKLKAKEVARYQSQFSDVIRSQPNVYGLFIRKTLDVVKAGGFVGLLTPTSFLSGHSFARLRRCLLERAEIVHIDMLSDRASMFISVEQETAISILRSGTGADSTDSETDICVLTPTGEYEHVGKHALSKTGAPWPIPKSVNDSSLLKTASKSPARLADYGFVAKVGHLVAFRDKRRRFKTRRDAKASACVVPIVWAGDISVQGFEHGRLHNKQRDDYFVEVASSDHLSVVRGPSVLLQRLTSNDQRHRLVAAFVPVEWQEVHGGFVAENHVIVLQTQKANEWTPEMMSSLLNSAVINKLFRAISGAANVAVFELNELPLPEPARLKKALVENGNLEIAVRTAFGISPQRERKAPKAQSVATRDLIEATP
jgi:adenine-specific DNA-methyltransferase